MISKLVPFYAALVAIFPALYAALLIMGLFYTERFSQAYGDREPTLFRYNKIGLSFHACSVVVLVLSFSGLLFCTFRDRYIPGLDIDLSSIFEGYPIALTVLAFLGATIILFVVNVRQVRRLSVPDQYVSRFIDGIGSRGLESGRRSVDQISSIALAALDRFDRRLWTAIHRGAVTWIKQSSTRQSSGSSKGKKGNNSEKFRLAESSKLLLEEMRYWDQVSVAKGLLTLRGDTLDSLVELVTLENRPNAIVTLGLQIVEEIARTSFEKNDEQTLIRVFQSLHSFASRFISAQAEQNLQEVLRVLGRMGELAIDHHVPLRSVISDHELRTGFDAFVNASCEITTAFEAAIPTVSASVYCDILSALGTRIGQRVTSDDNYEHELVTIEWNIRQLGIASARARDERGTYSAAYWLSRLYESLVYRFELFREVPQDIASSIVEIGLESHLNAVPLTSPMGQNTAGIAGPNDAAREIIAIIRKLNIRESWISHEMKEIVVKRTGDQRALDYVARAGGAMRTSFGLRLDWRTGEWGGE